MVRWDGCVLSGGKDINVAITLFICYNNTKLCENVVYIKKSN